MKKGGFSNVHTARIARTIGLVAPVVLFLYALLIPIGYASNLHYSGMPVLIALMLGWLFIGILRFLPPFHSPRYNLAVLVLHHLFATLYVLAVAGLSAAFIAGWALLCLMAFVYYGFYGFSISATTLVFVAAFDLAFRQYAFGDVIMNFINIIMTLLIASAAVALTMLSAGEYKVAERSRRRENLEHERILTIINNLADAVFVTDKSGAITIYNAAGLNLLDTNAAIDGKRLDEVFELQNAEGESINLFEYIKSARAVTVDDSLRKMIGEDVMRLEFTYAPIQSSFTTDEKDKLEGFIIIARDVTRLKSLEEERDEFISVVSHELRTPVAVAEGSISNAQLMLDRGQADEKLLKEGLAAAHDQVIYLAKMINDLSTLSRAERGVMAEAETIDVAQMAHELYNEYSPEAAKQKLHLNLELGPKVGQVTTSRLYLHELLQNFITNSIKYTKQGSVTLTISKNNDEVLFAVSDTGIGISKSDQAKVFNKFYRSEDYRTRETGGTGLGLYVAMKLSKKIGTQLALKSRLNHGSTFSFKLPAAKS